MNTQKELVMNLYAISALSEKLAKTDKRYERLSKVSKRMAIMTEKGMRTDDVIEELFR